MLELNEITIEDQQEQGLTSRDLKMVIASFGSKYSVTIFECSEGLWTVTVKFDREDGKSHSIRTARGDVKSWRNLVGAVGFVKEYCGLATEVFVEVAGWKLYRLNHIPAKRPEEKKS